MTRPSDELADAMRAAGIDASALSRVETIRPEPEQVWTPAGEFGDFDVALDEARGVVGMPDGTALSVSAEGRQWLGVLWRREAHDAPPIAGADGRLTALTMLGDDATIERFRSWRWLWEGPDADAALMLSVLTGADRQALVLAVCGCVRLCLPSVPEGDAKAAVVGAIDAAEGFAFGRVDEATLERAGGRADGFGKRESVGTPVSEACHAARSLAALASPYSSGSRLAVLSVKGAAEAIGGSRWPEEVRRWRLLMAPIVRAMIPVGVPMMLQVRRLHRNALAGGQRR